MNESLIHKELAEIKGELKSIREYFLDQSVPTVNIHRSLTDQIKIQHQAYMDLFEEHKAIRLAYFTLKSKKKKKVKK